METRANYVLVGGFVLALVAGLLAFILWLAKVQFDVELKRFDIYFVGPVTGLKVGSSVSYRGISVGEVTEIEIDPENLER
jgi:ABC-type transport system involved in resistance to organic solvents, periplasmic component